MDKRREYLLKKSEVCPLDKEELFELHYKNNNDNDCDSVDLNKTHYTYCEIEFVDDDDHDRQEVIIKSNDEYIEDKDDDVFFFGLHYNKIVEFCKNNEIIENEWKIVKVRWVSDEI